ncbi:aminoacetone oxidase family FAD-binding enzyme, partial [Flavobacterium sp.]|uniref:aminoacetone oxidase family FAD-binding enzyme n=1 Tax=Flavobacterium sp. TaxID=239 RepID=UPI003528F3CD
WKIETNIETFKCEKIVITTGSNPKIWELLSGLKHTIIPPVPSLFTFNIKNSLIQNLMGLSTNVSLKVLGTKLKSNGALLITHWGLSGPAILRLSAWGARVLFDKKYQFVLQVNWLGETNFEEAAAFINNLQMEHAKKQIGKFSPFDFPKRLWENILAEATIKPDVKWAELTKKQRVQLAEILTNSQFQVNGKSTFKEEFVTAGGVDLKEVNFKTMQSKHLPNLYFAGEVLNIDAITGGFNFQNAWTTAYIVSQNI